MRHLAMLYYPCASEEMVQKMDGPFLRNGFMSVRFGLQPILEFESALQVVLHRTDRENVHDWLDEDLEFWLSYIDGPNLGIRSAGGWLPRQVGSDGCYEVDQYYPCVRETVEEMFRKNSRSAVWGTTILGGLRHAPRRATYTWCVTISAGQYGCNPCFVGPDEWVRGIRDSFFDHFGADRVTPCADMGGILKWAKENGIEPF